jgi:hypothetical protein
MRHMAVQPALAGADTTAQARFASTGKNTGPQFGVVVHYQDPQNYYYCYRQTGGSSRLRIARVLSGVETVLKSVAVSNPALNRFFTLSCRASAGTIVLKLNGATKASVADGALASGSVGLALGYGTSSGGALSHRADDFSATVR